VRLLERGPLHRLPSNATAVVSGPRSCPSHRWRGCVCGRGATAASVEIAREETAKGRLSAQHL
jgi:hypothetical protein